jgi:hypothetical protein
MLGWHRHLKTFIIVHYFALKLLVVWALMLIYPPLFPFLFKNCMQ